MSTKEIAVIVIISMIIGVGVGIGVGGFYIWNETRPDATTIYNADGDWRVGVSIEISQDYGKNMIMRLIDGNIIVEEFKTWRTVFREDTQDYQYTGMSKQNWSVFEIQTFRWVWFDNETNSEYFDIKLESSDWVDVWKYGTSLIHYINGDENWGLFMAYYPPDMG